MGKDTEEFEQFYQAESQREPATLKGLIDGWEVLESRGTAEHRVLILQNKAGEKRILKQFSHQQNARMKAEMEALNAVHEQGIPKLYDFAEDGEFVYLVREYVEGENLEEYFAAHGPCAEQEALRITAQLCALLVRLHQRSIIHRDVKPQNVILTPNRRVYLIDFDISRKFTQGESHDTEYLGTRNIAPPEQFGYGQTDARTDIYSLGVVLLYLMTGSYDLRELPKLPPAVRKVVRRCTYFAPERRYQTAAQLLRKLRTLENRKKRNWTLAGAALLAALLVGAALFSVSKHTRTFPDIVTLNADAPVAFQEPLIEQSVRAQLNKTSGEPITYGELAAISEIYLYGNYTDGQPHDPDYRGDSVFVNGTRIDHGTVQSLNDLLMMPNLRVLRLYRQPVVNVDPLAPLTKLEELYLDESWGITDIAAIAGLTGLRTLDIGDTAVSDLSPLAGCIRLRSINLERIPCEDFSVLSRFSYLEYLNVNEASPEAVMAAVAGKTIDYLWLDFAELTDIEPFMRADGVMQLHAKHNNITSLEGIDALTMLEYVDVAYNPITDLRPLLLLPRLKALRIDRSMAAAWDAIQPEATFAVEWQD